MTIPSLVGGATPRIYGVELPVGQADDMPRTAVVVTGSGGAGIGSNSYAQLNQSRFDVRCYGASFAEAQALHWVVYEELKQLRRETVGGVLIHNLTVESTAVYLRDADGEWPAVLSVWNATVAEVAVA